MSVRKLPLDIPDEKYHRFQIASTVNEIADGRQNNTGRCTLNASTTTTIVAEPRIRLTMKVFLQPTTANAVADPPRVSAVADGTFTLVHASNANTDKIFDYVFHG